MTFLFLLSICIHVYYLIISILRLPLLREQPHRIWYSRVIESGQDILPYSYLVLKNVLESHNLIQIYKNKKKNNMLLHVI